MVSEINVAPKAKIKLSFLFGTLSNFFTNLWAGRQMLAMVTAILNLFSKLDGKISKILSKTIMAAKTAYTAKKYRIYLNIFFPKVVSRTRFERVAFRLGI